MSNRLTPEQRIAEIKQQVEKFYSDCRPGDDDEIVAWSEVSSGERFRPGMQPWSRKNWLELHDPTREVRYPELRTDQERAERVALYQMFVRDAQAAELVDDDEFLKKISDAARRALAEIPAVVPVGGFVDAFEYDDCLSAEEIKHRLLNDLRLRGLAEWYATAEADRNAGNTIQ